MKKADSVTKRIQKINLETYTVFRDLCRKNHLRYYAISGTALGQSLWRGFIPWDDDMDIAMPVDDFEKFKQIKLPNNYDFLELPWLGGKLYNKQTTLIEAPYVLRPEKYIGVFLDIVPLIGVPDEPSERRAFIREVEQYHIEALAIERAPELKIFSGQNEKAILAWRKKIISKYPFGETNYCIDLSNFPKGTLYSVQGFLDAKEGAFEDVRIPISSCQDDDLARAYGKIVKYVPEQERQLNHHNFYNFCDLETPVEKYRREFQDVILPVWLREVAYKNHLFGSAAVREVQLYKAHCRELERTISGLERDLKIVRASKSYRIGNTILKPLSKIKKAFFKD